MGDPQQPPHAEPAAQVVKTYTVTSRRWYPSAPSGNTGTSPPDWVTPRPSVARTRMVWRPRLWGVQRRPHSRHAYGASGSFNSAWRQVRPPSTLTSTPETPRSPAYASP